MDTVLLDRGLDIIVVVASLIFSLRYHPSRRVQVSSGESASGESSSCLSKLGTQKFPMSDCDILSVRLYIS